VKHNASEAKIIDSPQQTSGELAGGLGVSVEAQPPASGFEFAPEYAAELRAAEVSSATVMQAPVGASAPEAAGVDAPGWSAGIEASTTLRRWTPILLKFASVQLGVQAIGFAAGILVVRNLSKAEYAYYTLCNSMLATVLVLSDGGISSALSSIGGRVWSDRGRLSQLMRTALRLRRVMAAVTLPIVISVLVWLLWRNGAPPGKIAILLVIVVVGCGLELVTRIYAVALRLRSEVRQIQRQALVSAMVKFALIAAALVWLNVDIALLAVVAGFAVQYWMMRKWSRAQLDADAASDPQMRREIVSVVRRQSPHAIYYCLQSQIVIWLISIFGNAERVAEVGALARLAVVFSILSAVTSDLLFPAFARTQDPGMVRRRYLQIVLAFVVMSGMLICLVALFPAQVLSVLGARYSGLAREGVLMAVSSVVGAVAGLVWGLNASRAWIIPPVQFIPVILLIQIGLAVFLDLSTVRGVLLFSTVTALSGVVWSIGFALLRMHRLQNAS